MNGFLDVPNDNKKTNNYLYLRNVQNIVESLGIVPLLIVLMSIDHDLTEVANSIECDRDMHKLFSCTLKFESCAKWQ